LWVDSYLAYLLHSRTGTLIVGEMGEVESDILVAVAIIDGQVRGNIHATERVELQSHARVIGDIESPAVAIHTGAVFEGQCRFVSGAANESASKARA
jgi:cytoskeletal protein CcmA (bactofilin family)